MDIDQACAYINGMTVALNAEGFPMDLYRQYRLHGAQKRFDDLVEVACREASPWCTVGKIYTLNTFTVDGLATETSYFRLDAVKRSDATKATGSITWLYTASQILDYCRARKIDIKTVEMKGLFVSTHREHQFDIYRRGIKEVHPNVIGMFYITLKDASVSYYHKEPLLREHDLYITTLLQRGFKTENYVKGVIRVMKQHSVFGYGDIQEREACCDGCGTRQRINKRIQMGRYRYDVGNCCFRPYVLAHGLIHNEDFIGAFPQDEYHKCMRSVDQWSI